MIIFDTPQDIIAAYNEIEKPLSSDTIVELLEVAAITPKSYQWMVFEGKCRICSMTLDIMAPYCDDIVDSLECPNCGNYSVQELEELEDWQLN